MKRILIGLAIVLILLVISGFSLIRLLNFFPSPQMPVKVICDGKKPLILKKGTKLRILSWNIQYGGSRKYHFFYDGGKAVYPAKADVEMTLKQISAVIKKVNPDIILWQEVDRNSTRTSLIDEAKVLLKEHPQFKCWASTPYHKSAYIPSPSHQHLKRVQMDLTIFSKYKITRATRHALPMLKESFLRQAFNLKRAILEVEIPVKGGKPLILLDTHLSAFSYGDGTLDKQVAMLKTLAEKAEAKGYWLLAGDLNLLPPGDDPSRLGSDSKYYNAKHNPIDLLYKSLKPALSIETYNKNKELYYSYIQFGKKKTDRWIDHTFVGKKVTVTKYQVLQKDNNISDHLPIVIEITF